VKLITYKQYDKYINEIVVANVANTGSSVASCTIADQAGVIECVRIDTQELEVKDDWTKIIRNKYFKR